MSELTQNMASPLVLREWCRVSCARYPSVEIKNMSTSFRDGLAFCAIIHKHQPNLIDFSSLSKDNAYENNKLAFEVAETKLGIPALLDPKNMVSCEVPDSLSITTYLSLYYSKFHAGPTSLRSSCIILLINFTNSESPSCLKRLKSPTHLDTSKDHLSKTRSKTVCKLCFKPVHLIQRHLVDGEVYHRSCFRCNVCHSTLLPKFYTQGSDPGSLICTYHITDSKSACVDFTQKRSTENQPKCVFQMGYYSFGGLAITSVPHYTKKTESQDKLVCEPAETEGKAKQEKSTGVKDDKEKSSVGLKSMVKKPEPLLLPPPSDKDRTVEGAEQNAPAPTVADSTLQQEVKEPSERSSPCVQATEGSGRPVPAPRRSLHSFAVPVPAPRIKTSQSPSSSSAADSASSQCQSPPVSPCITSPTSGKSKVKTNHPWLGIIHSGPWTQLPPAPPPVTIPQAKSNLQGPRYRPKVPPPNPFVKEVDEETCNEAAKHEPAEQTCSVKTCHSESSGNLTNKSVDMEVAVCSGDAEMTSDESGNVVKPMDKPIRPNRQEAVSANTVETTSELTGNTISSSVLDENRATGDSLLEVTESTTGPQATSNEAQSHILPRSVSVPAISSAHSQSSLVPDSPTKAIQSVTSSQSKQNDKENPFNLKLAIPKSETFQAFPSQRAPAPGHGFPLVKRKVQTDQNVSTGDLQVEMGELDKQLGALEKRGVELEKNLRDCKNDKKEMEMLTEWFSLIYKRNVLVRRDTELVYLSQQQKLEEKQADVEYDLRCLLNKPESDWRQEDRNREQQLTNELVAVIEQRDQIISSLEQDRQREREEDVLWEAMMKNKELQKEGLKYLKNSKGRLKPAKVFKMLSSKAESTKNSMDKKS